MYYGFTLHNDHLKLVYLICYLIGRYVAPEVFRNEEYDTKVDVFSFALILQEVQFLFTVSG